MILGLNKNDEAVMRLKEIANKHLFAVGGSGTRKTTTLTGLAVQEAEAGNRIIIINMHQSLMRASMYDPLKRRYETIVHVIDVAKDGIKVPMFDKMTDINGNIETDDAVIERISSMLEVGCELTEPQANKTYLAVEDCYINDYFEDGLKAVYDWLEGLEKNVASNAAAKMRKICKNNVIRDGNFLETDKPIIEIDLNGLEFREQAKVAMFILEFLMHAAIKGKFLDDPIIVWVDEAQNCDWSPKSALNSLINEVRRMKIELWLSLPSINVTGKKDINPLMQCATKLFFAPLASERRAIADIINPNNPDIVVNSLARLKPGECIATGAFNINGVESNKYVKIKPIVYKDSIGKAGKEVA